MEIDPELARFLARFAQPNTKDCGANREDVPPEIRPLDVPRARPAFCWCSGAAGPLHRCFFPCATSTASLLLVFFGLRSYCREVWRRVSRRVPPVAARGSGLATILGFGLDRVRSLSRGMVCRKP